jgi:putative aldouronate transport system permease protein
MADKKWARQSRGDKIFDSVNLLLIILVLIIILYPLYFVIIASFSNAQDVVNGRVFIGPIGVNFEAYKKVFAHDDIMMGYRNTILYTILGTTINLIMTILAAYPLSRKDLKGRGIIMAFLAFTMFFGGGLIPTYLVVKRLQMTNTIWALLIPSAISTYNVVIMRTYFSTSIPYELQEAALIDGCSNTKILLKIILPLSTPIIAVMVLFYAVGHWNAYFNAIIYLTDRDKFPLQLIIREILIQNQTEKLMQSGTAGVDIESIVRQQMVAESLKYAVIVVASLPMLILYPILQKYFVKGIMLGALKG